MRKRAKWTFVLALIVLGITIGRIVLTKNLSDVAFDRVQLGSVIAALILILAACVVISRVAADPHGRGQMAAIHTLVSAACTFIGFAFDLFLQLLDERGAAIGPALLILIGLPSLVISSMLAWLLSRTTRPTVTRPVMQPREPDPPDVASLAAVHLLA